MNHLQTKYKIALAILPTLSQCVGIQEACNKIDYCLDKLFEDLSYFVHCKDDIATRLYEGIDDPVIFKTIWSSCLIFGWTEMDDGEADRHAKWPVLDWANVYSDDLHKYLTNKWR